MRLGRKTQYNYSMSDALTFLLILITSAISLLFKSDNTVIIILTNKCHISFLYQHQPLLESN